MIDISKLKMAGPFLHRPVEDIAGEWIPHGNVPATDDERKVLEVVDPQIKQHMKNIVTYLAEGKTNSFDTRIYVRQGMTVDFLNNLRSSIIATPLWANYLDDRVICDELNNPPQMVDDYMFGWDLYIKISNRCFANWRISPNKLEQLAKMV